MSSQDLLYYGALLECKVCGGNLEFIGNSYSCTGELSEWATCTYNTKNPPRKQDPIKLPDSVLDSPVSDVRFLVILITSIYKCLFLYFGFMWVIVVEKIPRSESASSKGDTSSC